MNDLVKEKSVILRFCIVNYAYGLIWWHISNTGMPPPLREPGGYFTKVVRGCACRTSKIRLSTNFLPNFSTISILFSKRKHPILSKLGALYNNLPKIPPIYVIWAPSSLMKTPDRYTKFREKVPQKAYSYEYHVNVRPPPGLGVRCTNST